MSNCDLAEHGLVPVGAVHAVQVDDARELLRHPARRAFISMTVGEALDQGPNGW